MKAPLPLLLSACAVLGGCGDDRTGASPPFASLPPEPFACLPNLDGRIEASEIRPHFGVTAEYRVAKDHAVDLVGSERQSGEVWWDFSFDAETDGSMFVSASTLEGKWYRDSFPGGEFAAPADAEGLYESIYARDAHAVWLLGVASVAGDPPEQRTLFVYTDPVEAFRLPLEPGQSWTATGLIENGQTPLIQGPLSRADTYRFDVDAVGQVALPDLRFTSVLRVRQTLSIEALGTKLSRRQVTLLDECIGEVVRAVSRDGEIEEDFTRASEIRRLRP